MAKTINNPGYEQAKRQQAEELERERERSANLEMLMQYQNQLNHDRQAVVKHMNLSDKFGFAFANGYGQMSDKEFKEQLAEQYEADGMTSVDAELKASVVLAKEQKKYEDMRQALANEGLIDDSGKIDSPAKQFGPIVFDSELSSSESIADYESWYGSISEANEQHQQLLASDAFDSYVRYAEMDAENEERIVERGDVLDDEYSVPESEETISDAYDMMDEPVADNSELDNEEMTKMFHDELARYANGEMSDFEKMAFKNSVADGMFGQNRAGLAESLDYLAFGSPTSKQQVGKIAEGIESKWDSIARRGVPQALNEMPGNFDPEYTSKRGVPDALKQGLEGYQPGIDYEME